MQKGAIFGALAVIAAAFLVPGNIPATSPVIPGDSTATPARVTASGFLSAEAGLSHAYVLGGEGNIVSTRLRLRAPSAEKNDQAAGRRLPMDVVIVLDRSGSMSAEDRIGFARRGLIEAVRQLGENDRVGVVSFSDDVRVEMELMPATEARRQIAERAAAIEAGGMTFLSGGMAEAERMLERGMNRERQRQVLLLSDGHANRGIVGEELRQLGEELGGRGIMVNAMGVGSDYAVATFIALGEGSGGGYAYVTAASRIPAAIEGELARAQSIIVRDLKVRLALPAGVTLERVYKQAHRQVGPNTYEIGGQAMRAGEEREVLVDLHITAPKAGWLDTNRAASLPIATWTVVCGSPTMERADGATDRLTLALEAHITSDRQLAAAIIDPDILGGVEGMRGDLAWADAAPEVRAGNYDAAATAIRREAERLQARNEELQSPSVSAKIADLFGAARRIETRSFYGGAPAAEATMGQNQAALSAGVY